MSSAVVLSWDANTRILEYVEVNRGFGGTVTTVDVGPEVAEHISDELADRPLPWVVADLEAEGEIVLLDASGGRPAVRCSVKAVGPLEARRFELRARADRTVVARLPAADLCVADVALAGAAEALDYLYVEGLAPPGCWIGCEGGIDHWLELRRLAVKDERSRREGKRRFINPYTFVPFPEAIARCEPEGHHWLRKGRLSGTFMVTWEFTTPFQAPQGASGTTRLRFPGSSVKGAVRSVHEALAGGCLRIFDEDFIPSYRDTPTVRSADWTLAQVSGATRDGQPLTVQLCDEVVWVDARQLQEACRGSLKSGSRVTIKDEDIPPKPNSLGRKELDKNAPVSRGGDWVVLITAPGTRSAKKDTYFLACGKLGQRQAEVTENAWRAFRIAVAGADDLRRTVRSQHAENTQELQPTRLVTFDSERIGYRRVVTGRLWPSDVLWVRTRGRDTASLTAEELSLAAVWRHPGWRIDAGQQVDRETWSAKRRVSADLLACRDPTWLCPTCQVFGSADQNPRDPDGRAEQRAYAGHVRFGDACSDEPVELALIQRAPLGAPRPGAGQFYLAYEDTSPARDRDSRSTREWGSEPDSPEPRQLRGRKFYWHADPAGQKQPRHIARNHQKDKRLAVERWIAPAQIKLTQRISFDNLSEAELGGVLAAFQPHRVLTEPGGEPLRLHLGGGKPLGLGSCFATVSDLRVWTAESRYGDAPDVRPVDGTYVSKFTASCSEEVRRTWPLLSAVLAEEAVDAGRVWYPPGAYWPDRAADEQTFDEPFAFFTASSGMFLQDKAKRPLVPLPTPGSGDQSLPIIRKADLE